MTQETIKTLEDAMKTHAEEVVRGLNESPERGEIVSKIPGVATVFRTIWEPGVWPALIQQEPS